MSHLLTCHFADVSLLLLFLKLDNAWSKQGRTVFLTSWCKETYMFILLYLSLLLLSGCVKLAPVILFILIYVCIPIRHFHFHIQTLAIGLDYKLSHSMSNCESWTMSFHVQTWFLVQIKNYLIWLTVASHFIFQNRSWDAKVNRGQRKDSLSHWTIMWAPLNCVSYFT